MLLWLPIHIIAKSQVILQRSIEAKLYYVHLTLGKKTFFFCRTSATGIAVFEHGKRHFCRLLARQ